VFNDLNGNIEKGRKIMIIGAKEGLKCSLLIVLNGVNVLFR